jgi:acetate kinase
VSQCIAVINAGSSSVKFALYDAAREENCLLRGTSMRLASRRLRVADTKGEIARPSRKVSIAE